MRRLASEGIVGWNFGCVIIAFDFQSVVDKLVEPELRQFMTGAEDDDERRSKEYIDLGTGLFPLLKIDCVHDDAPISFSDATSRDFDGYALGVLEGKTVLVGRRLGLAQDIDWLIQAYSSVSSEHGPVAAFWCNDASDSYMLSVFRDGKRVRFWATGPGLDENHGPLEEGERDENVNELHGHDRLMGVLEAAAGCSFGPLTDLQMERFSPC